MAIRKELLDEILKDYDGDPESFFGNDGILNDLTKSLMERALEAEMTHHLGYEKHSTDGHHTGNSRNGKTEKTVKGKRGQHRIKIPRDRKGDFDPILIKKHERIVDGLDDKIISMYTRGMSTRDIQGHIKEIYGFDISPELVSQVTNEVVEELKAWQNRPLDEIYPIVFFDALVIKCREHGHIINKSVYLAIGINVEGKKEALGLWIEENEGAKFWLKVITEIKNRGVKDIFIACVDGLKGFPEAIESVFEKTEVQLCIVHMVRNSLRFVPYKEKKEVAHDLKEIYKASTEELAKQNLEKFREKWDDHYPMIGKSWSENWGRLSGFLAYPQDIRKAIYTTNAIESINMTLRKVIKTRASFPNDTSALKVLYLGLNKVSKKWTMPIRSWTKALNQFTILFGDRMPKLM